MENLCWRGMHKRPGLPVIRGIVRILSAGDGCRRARTRQTTPFHGIRCCDIHRNQCARDHLDRKTFRRRRGRAIAVARVRGNRRRIGRSTRNSPRLLLVTVRCEQKLETRQRIIGVLPIRWCARRFVGYIEIDVVDDRERLVKIRHERLAWRRCRRIRTVDRLREIRAARRIQSGRVDFRRDLRKRYVILSTKMIELKERRKNDDDQHTNDNADLPEL